MKHLIHKSDLCSGCRSCQMICAFTFFKVNNPKKARLEIDRISDTKTRMAVCVQCRERPCLKACPEGAISEKNGSVRIDSKKCTACGICVTVCPYEGIKFHPRIGAVICLQCGVCVETCPVGALELVE
ncbi:MAG: 4Fe-4S dicluster domain-containing protein [PVC group bacterium]